MKPTTLSLICALGLGACDSCKGTSGNAGSSAAPSAAARSAPDEQPAAPSEPAVGVLKGVVRLADGAQLPSYAPEQMEKRVLDHAERGPWPNACTPPKIVDRQPLRVADGGGLSGVVIAGSGFSREQRRPQRVHEVTIRDCRLEPQTVTAMVGDVLRVQSEVAYPFMPAHGNQPQLRTLTPGQTYDVKLDKPGVSPVLCGFTAPCGRTDVVVMTHPLSVVTGADGSFRIDDFPADEELALSAWHPLLQEASVQVRLGRGEEKHVELVVTPLAGAAADAAPREPAPAEPANADADAANADADAQDESNATVEPQ